ncbi:MAG: glycosyltransferase family 4 protein, partial [Pseudomonadota bacterium]
RILPIPLGVDQATFAPSAAISRAPQRIITTASADTPLKGLHILFEAFHLLLQELPEAELVVIGKLRKGRAKKVWETRGLKHRVTFKHDLSREDLADAFRAATVAVTPSLYEGFGLPAAEAMSCGTPVIVTTGGALPEVAGQAGIIVPKGDAAALAREMINLLQDPARQKAVGEACLHRARAEFNWERIAPKYLALFERAMAAPC